MTTEELIAAGLPVDPVVEGAEHAAPTEDSGSPSGSRSREDGEVQSDNGEDIGDVDAGVSDLIKARTSGPLPPSLVFGESKVTTNTIREYEKVGFFSPGAGRAPLDEQIPTPRDGEVVVFRDFFIRGLRFPCDPVLPAILDAFSVKIHQLSPTSFSISLTFSRYFMRTGFLASLSFSICSWITFESVLIMKVCCPKALIFLNANSRASYSVVLFVECSFFANTSRTAYLMTTPVGDVTTAEIPTPL
jgi:hypothetical protein